MKTIINNFNNLKESDIDIITNKVRAIIIDDFNNVIITKYADMYMLPGGKIDKDENEKDALIRELKEELGIKFNGSELIPLVTFKNYMKDYPLIDKDGTVNKLNNTIYYVIRSNKKTNKNSTTLTERESKNNFNIYNLKLDDLINIVSNYESKNERNIYFKKELLSVLNEYINTNKIIDMHCHSNYSDGELSPNKLINLAIKNNIGTLSITDHDTIDGIKNIDNSFFESSIKIINGIELSAKTDKGKMHILGYDFDISNKELNDKLLEFKTININYVLSILEELKKDYNIFFTYDEIKELVNSNHNLGRPDVAKLMIKNGYVKTVQEAFDKYLIEIHSKLGERRKGIDYKECINLILNSGGIPVLAHPKTLELSDKDLLILLKEMINFGLKGIEVYHSSHTPEEIKYYLEIANKYNLLISGGSDYHGKIVKPDVELGYGINNNLKIKKLSILGKIKR